MQLLDSVVGAVIEVVPIDVDPAVGDPNRPEEATGRDARTDVVNLMRVGRQRIYQTLIDVKSYEAESSFVLLSIHPDVLATHEPVVAVEEQRRGFVCLRIPAGTRALDGGDPSGAVVVEDRARLHAWTEEGVVAREESARNRNRIFPGCVDEFWEPHRRGCHCGRGNGRRAQELPARHRALPEMIVSHIGPAGDGLPHAVAHLPLLLERSPTPPT